MDDLLGNPLGRLEYICGVHEARKGVEGVVDFQMGSLEVRLNVCLVHWIDCI